MFKKILNPFFSQMNFHKYKVCTFTGKTETGFKFTTPKMKMKSVKPIYPPPGENLEIPGNYLIKQNGHQKTSAKKSAEIVTKFMIDLKT